jgi:hypothetical protein
MKPLLNLTSCTHVNNSHIETVKYLINKDLFMYLKLQSISQCKIFDVISPSLSVRCQYSSVMATAMLSNEDNRESAT